MSTDMTVATPDTTVDDLRKMFNTITGLPVVESSATRKLVGVVSKKDLEKPGATVGKVHFSDSSPHHPYQS
jgi:CBS-domain-containing membrane protein